MTKKTWISLKDELPRAGCGVLIKIEPKDNNDEDEYKGKLFFGYIHNLTEMVPNQDGLFRIIAVLDGQQLYEAYWKAWKNYDHDEIFWLYNEVFTRSYVPPEPDTRFL